MEVIDNICTKLRLHELEKIPLLKDLHAKTQVKPAYVGLGALTVAALLWIIGYGSSFLQFLVGFLYPAYMSFKAIENTRDSEDDKLWLTYWVVFSFLYVFDGIIGYVLSIIPFAGLLKIPFIIWLFHPKTKGALLIYNRVVRDILRKYEGQIDSGIAKAQKALNEVQPGLDNAARDLKRGVIDSAIN